MKRAMAVEVDGIGIVAGMDIEFDFDTELTENGEIRVKVLTRHMYTSLAKALRDIADRLEAESGQG